MPALLLILLIGPSPNFKTFLRLSVFDGRPVEMKKFWGGGVYQLCNIVGHHGYLTKKIFHFKSSKMARET